MSDIRCNEVLRKWGSAYPRNCMLCGKGPCKESLEKSLNERILDLVQPHLPEVVFQDLEDLLGRIPN